MAYSVGNLTATRRLKGNRTHWTYISSDTLATIAAAGYFNGATALLRAGDPILVVGNGVPANHVVSSNNGSVVAVAAKLGNTISVKEFGAVGDGVTDDTAALQLAMTALASRRELVFEAGDYLTSTALTLSTSNRKIRFEPGARVIPTGLINTLAIQGTAPATFVTLSSNALTGARSAAVADGSAFSEGQWVFLRSQAVLPDCLNSNGRKRGEWQQVAGVATNTVHFLGTLLYDYLTSDTAEVSTDTGCMVENITVEGFALDTGTLPSGTVRGIQAQYAANLRITDFDIRNTRALEGADNGSSVGINLDNVVNCWALRGRLLNLGYYGWAVDGASRRVWVSDVNFTRCRHATSIINNGAYGEPAYIHHDRLQAEYSILSGFDTHDVGRHIFYDRCVSISAGDHGFNCRAPLVNYTNCQSERSTLDGFAIAASCPDVVLDNCRALNNTRHGVASKNTDAVIRGGRFDTNNTGLTFWAAGVTVRGGRIEGCEIVNNGRLAIGWATEGGVQGRLTVRGVTAPQDGTNQTTFLGFEDAISGTYDLLDLTDSYLPGYTSNLLVVLGNEAVAGLPMMSGNRLIVDAAGAEMVMDATLVAGTYTVNTTAVRNYAGATGSTSKCAIRTMIALEPIAWGGTPGNVRVTAKTDNTSFVLTSDNAGDTSTYRCRLIH